MSVATLTSAASFAEPTSRIVLDQSNAGPVDSADDQSTDSAETMVQSVLAQANSATGEVTAWTAVDGRQSRNGAVSATATQSADGVWSYTMSNAAAQGSALTVGAGAQVDLTHEQSAGESASVSALSALRIGAYAGHTVQGVSAVSNVIETGGSGDQSLALRQSSAAAVSATARFDGADAEVETFEQAVSAAGNSLAAAGSESSVIADIDQSSSGDVTARTDAVIRTADYGGVSAAAAVGNTVRITADYGYGHAQGAQTNSGAVRAIANLDVGDFGGDLVSGSATATGNASLVSTIGADAYTGLNQTNSGPVSAELAFTGGAGGDGAAAGSLLSASAIGNAQSAYICSECPVGLNADMTQTNTGSVTARTSASQTGFGGAMTSSATAVGNAATFSTRQPG